MRVGIVYFENTMNKKLTTIVENLAEGIKSQGHQVDIINGNKDINSKLTIYNYIAIGTESINFLGGKIPPRVTSYLSNSGIIKGKRSYGFTIRNSLRTQKTLGKLMSVMEHEGMYLKKSDIISTQNEAKIIGSKLHIF
jgi:hypothetical protein